ncbi:MAG: hypothetical protein ACR2PL_12845 [Dehalococcoidia bacterium]
MPSKRPDLTPARDKSSVAPARHPPPDTRRPPSDRMLDAEVIERAFGEPIERILDPASWSTDPDLGGLYRRLDQEIADAVHLEGQVLPRVRELVLPALRKRAGAPPGGGVYQVSTDHLARIHRGLLFTGAVEACDGTSQSHDTLPLTIADLGVGLVGYRGDRGTWMQRLFRRDLRFSGDDPIEEALTLLDARTRRGGFEQDSTRDQLSEFSRRGIMTYAERAILTDRSNALWRMGHGQPAPLELLIHSNSVEFLRASLTILRRLILDLQKFVFVPSAPADRRLLTIGQALHPLEFAIVDTMEESWDRIVESGHHYTGIYHDLAADFVREVGPLVVVGVYRASAAAPAQAFYAHVDHAAEAALIAMADSTLQEHRGFPMLIDLADQICRVNFGTEVFNSAIQSAYAAAGEPTRYLAERRSRYRA